MTEDQIERAAERRMDRLDAAYLAGRMTDQDYRRAVRDLDVWTLAQERQNRKETVS